MGGWFQHILQLVKGSAASKHPQQFDEDFWRRFPTHHETLEVDRPEAIRQVHAIGTDGISVCWSNREGRSYSGNPMEYFNQPRRQPVIYFARSVDLEGPNIIYKPYGIGLVLYYPSREEAAERFYVCPPNDSTIVHNRWPTEIRYTCFYCGTTGESRVTIAEFEELHLTRQVPEMDTLMGYRISLVHSSIFGDGVPFLECNSTDFGTFWDGRFAFPSIPAATGIVRDSCVCRRCVDALRSSGRSHEIGHLLVESGD